MYAISNAHAMMPHTMMATMKSPQEEKNDAYSDSVVISHFPLDKTESCDDDDDARQPNKPTYNITSNPEAIMHCH
jgi:hypothetical protein